MYLDLLQNQLLDSFNDLDKYKAEKSSAKTVQTFVDPRLYTLFDLTYDSVFSPKVDKCDIKNEPVNSESSEISIYDYNEDEFDNDIEDEILDGDVLLTDNSVRYNVSAYVAPCVADLRSELDFSFVNLPESVINLISNYPFADGKPGKKQLSRTLAAMSWVYSHIEKLAQKKKPLVKLISKIKWRDILGGKDNQRRNLQAYITSNLLIPVGGYQVGHRSKAYQWIGEVGNTIEYKLPHNVSLPVSLGKAQTWLHTSLYSLSVPSMVDARAMLSSKYSGKELEDRVTTYQGLLTKVYQPKLKGNRYQYSPSMVSKVVKPYFLLDGEQTVMLDYKALHTNILTKLISNKSICPDELDRWSKMSGDMHTGLASLVGNTGDNNTNKAIRDQVKIASLSFFNAKKNVRLHDPKYQTIRDVLQVNYPSIYKHILASDYSERLRVEETKLMSAIIEQCFSLNIPVVYHYDALQVRKSDANKVKELMNSEAVKQGIKTFVG